MRFPKFGSGGGGGSGRQKFSLPSPTNPIVLKYDIPNADVSSPSNPPKGYGRGPSGSMTIEYLTDLTCPGYDESNSAGTIQIVYFIPDGIQSTYHKNPGI